MPPFSSTHSQQRESMPQISGKHSLRREPMPPYSSTHPQQRESMPQISGKHSLRCEPMLPVSGIHSRQKRLNRLVKIKRMLRLDGSHRICKTEDSAWKRRIIDKYNFQRIRVSRTSTLLCQCATLRAMHHLINQFKTSAQADVL